MNKMDYWDLRTVVKDLVPRSVRWSRASDYEQRGLVEEKGRKRNYQEGDLFRGEHLRKERLLNTEEMNSFLEVSLRAQACPLPLNIDTWDGFTCPYNCIYCYANCFRASLYSSFFDNARLMGLRHCNPDFFKRELDRLFALRGRPAQAGNETARAVAMEVPMRFGIRFEDFIAREGRDQVSLALLRYLAAEAYPVMINTKSALVGREDYVRALADNKAGAAVHLTMITGSEPLRRRLESGAPSFEQRLEACRALIQAGVKVVARIEPFMAFINDDRADTDHYIERLKWAGVKHLTFDTYSYSANNPGIEEGYFRVGLDFRRMFLIMSDCQWLGSLMLGRFMDHFRERGFSCSTFDFGNVPSNDSDLCCSVDSQFLAGGYNRGNILTAARWVIRQKGARARWRDFATWVGEGGGFLSTTIQTAVQRLWNLEERNGYQMDWIPGFKPHGPDQDGMMVWSYSAGTGDFREQMLTALMRGEEL